MKWLMSMLVITAVVFSPFGKSVRSKLPVIWQGFVNSFDADTKNVIIKSNEGSSYAKSPKQTGSDNQRTSRPSRGIFTQLKNETSSLLKKNSAEYALSQQRAMNARDFNYGNTASLKQQRYENNNAFKQSSGSNVSQFLSKHRLSMSRELASY